MQARGTPPRRSPSGSGRGPTAGNRIAVGVVTGLTVAGILALVAYFSGSEDPPPPDPPAQTEGSTVPPTDVRVAPRAPEFESCCEPGFEEQLMQVQIPAGEERVLEGMDLFSGPALAEPTCASGTIALTWQVRDPFPTGGEDLELRANIPMNERTELVGQGMSGTGIGISYCGQLHLRNLNLTEVSVELRYVSSLSG